MYRIVPSGAAINGEYAYFSARDYNALLRTNLHTYNTEYLCKFERETCNERIHIKAFSHEDDVWFIPLYGEHIAKYNIKNNNLKYFKLDIGRHSSASIKECSIFDDGNDEEYSPTFLYANLIDDERIFMVPAALNNLIVLNMNVEKMDKIEFEYNFENELFSLGISKGDKIWLLPYSGTEMVALDYKTGNCSRIKMPEGMQGYYGGAVLDNGFVISESNSRYYLYSEESNEFECINTGIKSEGKNGNKVREMIRYKDNIYFLPNCSEEIFILNTKSKCITQIENNYGFVLGMLQFVTVKDDKLICYSFTEGIFFVIEGNKIAECIKCAIDDNTLNKLLIEKYGSNVIEKVSINGVISEESMGLNNYLKLL